MMEYFTYKKIQKHQAEKKAQAALQSPLLNPEDENFLERIVSAEGTPPPLPQRPLGLGAEAGDSTGNAAQVVVHDGNTTAEEAQGRSSKDKGKGKENETETRAGKDAKKPGRFSFLHRSGTKKVRFRNYHMVSRTPTLMHVPQNKDGLKADSTVVTPNEGTSEENDINKVLEDLNLSAINNRAFSISDESQQILQKFTVILKDLINGVPTAYDDLTHLLDDSQGTLAKSYDHLPSFLQKLIKTLPDKLTKNLAPELLAVATEAQALNATAAASGAGADVAGGAAGVGAAAMKFLKPASLKDLVTKPGAVVSMLKAIMNALKLRWPAFMGTNVLLSLGLFVLLFVFWYCHKRGREVRLEKEAKVDSEGRIIELDDDPMLPSGESSNSRPGPSRSDTENHSSSDHRSRPSSSERERDREQGYEQRERERDRDHVPKS
ncbi:hypothetical protein BUE80_DR000529 [Diplocarpon rosae]|nr:hypothetical protein BUE80_DR000529 [Diplocarpon rosae]